MRHCQKEVWRARTSDTFCLPGATESFVGEVDFWLRFSLGFTFSQVLRQVRTEMPSLGDWAEGRFPGILQPAAGEGRKFVELCGTNRWSLKRCVGDWSCGESQYPYARSALRWTHQDVDNQPPKLCPALMGEIFANELGYNPFIDESSYYRIILSGILGLDLYGRW